MKLFSKIKFRSFISKKIKKYSFYALGELILIIAGIFIAFQLNNWNDNRIKKNKTLEYLAGIKNDLKIDSMNFSKSLKFMDKMCLRKRILLERSDYNDLGLDSIVKLVKPDYKRKIINNQTFQKMKSSGITELPGFQDIYSELIQYYTTWQNEYIEFIDWDVEYTLKESEYWYYNSDFEISYNSESFPFLNDSLTQKKNLISKIRSIDGRNRIRISLFRKERTKESTQKIQMHCIKLIESINNRLSP